MEEERAKRAAEGLRYRLRVRLGVIARAARSARDVGVLDSVRNLQAALRAVEVKDSEWLDRRAERELRALDLEVVALEDAVGVVDQAQSTMPRWLRYLLLMIPVLAILLALLIIVDRRRRKHTIAAEDILDLDRAGPQAGARQASERRSGSRRAGGTRARDRSDTAPR